MDGQNPFRDYVNEAKEKLRAAELTQQDKDTLKTLKMELLASEQNYDEWHGENVFPLEWQLAKVQLSDKKK